ncbi:MAG TPA: O-antigen ligase family protein [Solirubrobacteraceae bacterium]|jgi:O-antigen ligase|nr:O-antigen ligase family protein [Solirubrobacteraceae bacterium]
MDGHVREPVGLCDGGSPITQTLVQRSGSGNYDAPVANDMAIGVDTRGARDASVVSLSELGLIGLMLLPGGLIVFLGFNAGGYFPGTPAVVALVLTQILLVRIVQARHPFEGLASTTLVAIGALACYAALTLASGIWSHSMSRALIEFDRAWLYLLVLVLFGTVQASADNLRWLIRGLVLGVSIVCVSGLMTRLLPSVWHTAPDVSNERLSYPVTYWNTLGLLAAIGIVLAFHLSCSLGERRVVRVLAAGVLPLLAATLFFTFSRGAMLAGAMGLVVYALVARPRGLPSAALAAIPTTAVLLFFAYRANLLDTLDPTTPRAVDQGHRVALVACACVLVGMATRLLLASVLDPRLRRRRSWPRANASLKRGVLLTTVAAVAVGVVAFFALGAPHALAHDWDRFIDGASTTTKGGDLRQRLTDPSNDGRTPLWRVALHGFSASSIHGVGAGMYQTLWDRERSQFGYVVNAHSLYLQAMAELGVPGLLLLLVLVGATILGLALRARGRQRTLYGALLAVAVVWVLHAGVDWDWEMPVVTIGFFAIAGLALSARGRVGRGWTPNHNTRLVLALLCLVTVALPVSIIGSQTRLGQAEHALYASNCAAATPAALSSIGWLDVRPEPYEIVGLCDIQRGQPRLALTAMREARSKDPRSWETYYALAIAQASAGMDPRANAELALRLNPLEPLTREAAKEFRGSSPTEWVTRAAIVRAVALKSNDLSIVPSSY